MLVASFTPNLCLSSFGTLDRSLNFIHTSPPPLAKDVKRQHTVHFGRPFLVTLHSNATQEVTLYSLIELPIFFPNKPHVYRQLISSLCWVLCQIQGDRQGQIPLYSPHLALTPVTRVSGRGSEFHAGCTICPLFTLPSICITDSRSEWH